MQKAWESPTGDIAQKLNDAVVVRSKPKDLLRSNEHNFSGVKDLLSRITQEDLDEIQRSSEFSFRMHDISASAPWGMNKFKGYVLILGGYSLMGDDGNLLWGISNAYYKRQEGKTQRLAQAAKPLEELLRKRDGYSANTREVGTQVE